MSYSRAASILIIIIATGYLLIITKSYLIPIVLAVIIWYLIRELRFFLQQSQFIKNHFPIWLQNIIVFALIFSVISLLSSLLTNSISQFSTVVPSYQKNIQTLNTSIQETLGLDIISRLEEYTGSLDVSRMAQPILNSVTGILSNGFLILLYCIFLLLEEATFTNKLKLMFKDKQSYKQFCDLLDTIDRSFGSYFSIKTLMSVITGVLSYIVLRIIEVDSPILWSFIIFLFNYIPSIGSLIATTFPVVIAMLQFGAILPGIWVLLGVGSIQILVGNFLEPRMMGSTLNISPLVVLISLFSWGAIWGIVGMILSVPIMVMLIFIFAQFPSTHGLAVMLSKNGKLTVAD
jgi:AI-2 transport protein TqsA